MKDNFQEIYSADLARYKGQAELYIRLFLYFFRKRQNSRSRIVRNVARILFRFIASTRGIEMSSLLQVGKGLYLGHAYNITINPNTIIGNNCNIHKGVVIGQQNRGKNKGVPTIGNEVWIGINAAIVGKVTIGDDVLIAPNSFVNCDVPSHSVVFGNPCIIKPRPNATEGYINNIV